MKIFVAVLLLSGVSLSVGIPEIIADTASTLHQVWSNCRGHPSCQYSCDRPDDRYDIACPRMCRGGNICEKGYLRQSNAVGSACILPADCPPNSGIFRDPPRKGDPEDDSSDY